MTAESGAPEPGRILVAGDWHGNEDWAVSVLRRVPGTLAGEPRRLILQLGDFGIWPDRAGQHYLDRIAALLAEMDAELWFIDGNHEDFPQLARLARGDRTPGGRVVVRPRLFHLPRGYRWSWHGLRWLACGGGVSLDRAQRTEGVDWWPDEEITDAQEAAIIAGGHADVLVSHDCPSGVAHTFGRPPPEWDPADLARNDAHRRRLQRIVDAVQPSRIMHGHLHRAYQRSCDFGYGPVQVTGLDADNRLRNFAVLDVADMRWELREGWFDRLRRSSARLCKRLRGDSFQARFARWAHKRGAVPFVQMEPTGVSVASIALGASDTYLREFARAVRAYRWPVAVSFGPEANGPFYSWGCRHTPAETYVTAWRHIHQQDDRPALAVFRAEVRTYR